MVSTPWFDYDIPFQEAAELGTRKVITDHSTIGIVITTDGSITEIPREHYVEAEERVIEELKELGKPFVVILNSANPDLEETRQLQDELSFKYDVPVITLNCLQLDQADLDVVLEEALYEFPVREVTVNTPPWVAVLDKGYWLKDNFDQCIEENVAEILKVREVNNLLEKFKEYDFIEAAILRQINLGTGEVEISLKPRRACLNRFWENSAGKRLPGTPISCG